MADRRGDVDDITTLLHLGDAYEAALMHNTVARFWRDEIYTFVGPILLAVNPFKPLHHLYGEDLMTRTSTQASCDLPPHVYAVVERAFRKLLPCSGYYGNLAGTHGSQSLIVSGESGAGKTETGKVALAYLMWRCLATRKVSDNEKSLASMLLQTNQPLEAFGNATTVRNSNSSRFGKCIRLGFDRETATVCRGQVGGQSFARKESKAPTHFLHSLCHTQTRSPHHAHTCASAAPPIACNSPCTQLRVFLHEKSRIAAFGEGERNFHIFYQLIAAAAEVDGSGGRGASRAARGTGDGIGCTVDSMAEAQLLDGLALSQPECYALLAPRDRRGRVTMSVPHSPAARMVDANRPSLDGTGFADVCRCLRGLGLADAELRQLVAALTLLLHLSNVRFSGNGTAAAPCGVTHRHSDTLSLTTLPSIPR